MIRQVDVCLLEIDQHVAQVQDNATQITRVPTVVDEMVQGIRYGGSVVGPNASVFDLFQGLVSKGEFQSFRNKVGELEQFNTQQSKVLYDSYPYVRATGYCRAMARCALQGPYQDRPPLCPFRL